MYIKPTIEEKQAKCSIRKLALEKRATKSELIFKQKLDNLGVNYLFQKGFIAKDYFCIVDFYLPRPHKLCIEIDGGYHNTPEQILKDERRTRYLQCSRRFKVLRLTNEQAESISEGELQNLISSI